MRFFISLVCAAALCVAAGCSDDKVCAPCAPVLSDRPLAQISLTLSGGGSAAASDTMLVFFSSGSDTLFKFHVTPADNNTIRTVKESNYAPFKNAAARLSDGVNDVWMFNARYEAAGWGAGTGNTEATLMQGGFTGAYTPDLAGTEITRAVIYLNDVAITQNAGNLSYTLSFRVVLMGRV